MKKPTITVVGLGTGNADQLTLGIWRKLRVRRSSICQNRRPSDDAAFPGKIDMSYSSFDSLYEQLDSFPDVYEAIAAALIKGSAAARSSCRCDLMLTQSRLLRHPHLAHSVPADLTMKSSTPFPVIRWLLNAPSSCCASSARSDAITLDILGGESFLDQAFHASGF